MKKTPRVVTKEQMLAGLKRAQQAIGRVADLAVDCNEVQSDSQQWKAIGKAEDLIFQAWLDLKYGEES